MNQLTSHNSSLSNNISLDISTQTTNKPKRKRIIILCNECNKKRHLLDKNHQICHVCYKAKSVFIPSGNKVIDDFIKHTLISGDRLAGRMVFVPYNQFKNVEFLAEGGFSKVYKAIWIDGPSITNWSKKKQSFCKPRYNKNYKVVLKKLNNSTDITSKELNELKIFHELSLKCNYINSGNVSKYFGITQDPVTKDIMIVMPYYRSGDLTNYITNDFYCITWNKKLISLNYIISGLISIHSVNIIHRDFHSGNIFFENKYDHAFIGDLGISKSATESTL
ncbi:kinase-like domain-containing protein [Rhizophagus clarus]|uniref:Kinase-like domain-containing protein n=1 Tax=Rhizophagus clarus TaxID=94130 RepID=A0A8H3LP29_9GLOM|nr:kinase-like domain-containing protein [Rhizophagus clarus]